MSSERVDQIRKISDEAIEHDQALVTELRERVAGLEADLASARKAIDLLNERQRVEWARAETAEAALATRIPKICPICTTTEQVCPACSGLESPGDGLASDDPLALKLQVDDLRDDLVAAREEVKQLKGCLAARDRGLARQAWLLKNVNTAHRPAHRPAAERVYIDRVTALEQRAERLERALRTLAKSQEEPAGELCWCSESEDLSAMSPADHATACIRAREALRPAPESP